MSIKIFETPTQKAVNALVHRVNATTWFHPIEIGALLVPLAQVSQRQTPYGLRMHLTNIGAEAIGWAMQAAGRPLVDVSLDVLHERTRQDELHPLPGGFPKEIRQEILVEEVGEVAKAVIEDCDLYDELTQVAAVCARWLEIVDAEEADDAR